MISTILLIAVSSFFIRNGEPEVNDTNVDNKTGKQGKKSSDFCEMYCFKVRNFRWKKVFADRAKTAKVTDLKVYDRYPIAR